MTKANEDLAMELATLGERVAGLDRSITERIEANDRHFTQRFADQDKGVSAAFAAASEKAERHNQLIVHMETQYAQFRVETEKRNADYATTADIDGLNKRIEDLGLSRAQGAGSKQGAQPFVQIGVAVILTIFGVACTAVATYLFTKTGG